MSRWKVVFHKELRSKHILVSNSDEVTMLDNLIGIYVPLEILEVPRNVALIGAIELIGTDEILAVEKLQRLFSADEVGLELIVALW
jgi:predicted nucleotidyltransferase